MNTVIYFHELEFSFVAYNFIFICYLIRIVMVTIESLINRSTRGNVFGECRTLAVVLLLGGQRCYFVSTEARWVAVPREKD